MQYYNVGLRKPAEKLSTPREWGPRIEKYFEGFQITTEPRMPFPKARVTMGLRQESQGVRALAPRTIQTSNPE